MASIAAIAQCVWTDTYASEGLRENLARYVLTAFTEASMQKRTQSTDVFVMEDKDHLLGFCVVAAREDTEIEALYILPRFQRQGLGQQLLTSLIEKHGSVWLSCWEKNERALNFYLKFGFVQFGESTFELENEKHRNVELSSCALIIARFSAPQFFFMLLSDMRSIVGYVTNGRRRHGGKEQVETGK